MTDQPLLLQIIICSTRPGRVGPKVAAWVDDQARAHGRFAVELVDLADFELPMLDEAAHPRHGMYEHEHTKRWSATVKRADAYVFVLPEYDFSMPASLLNALQVLYQEWTYKPAAFASYGGESGALRSVQMTKQVLTTFKMVPIVETVMIQHVASHIDKATGVFTADEGHPKKATAMLDELHRWAVALKPLHG
jgi:NAD(P)H-dependent FMN reductase